LSFQRAAGHRPALRDLGNAPSRRLPRKVRGRGAGGCHRRFFTAAGPHLCVDFARQTAACGASQFSCMNSVTILLNPCPRPVPGVPGAFAPGRSAGWQPALAVSTTGPAATRRAVCGERSLFSALELHPSRSWAKLTSASLFAYFVVKTPAPSFQLFSFLLLSLCPLCLRG